MRFLLLLTLIAFPIAEIWLLIRLADAYGWGLLVYLVGIGWLGLRLIREEKQQFSARMMQNITQGANPLSAVFGTARTMLAGVLLLIPGVITDIIAVGLLLTPSQKNKTTQQAAPDFATRSTFEEGDAGQFTGQYKSRKKSAFKFGANQSSDANNRAANDDVIEGEFTREEDK